MAAACVTVPFLPRQRLISKHPLDLAKVRMQTAHIRVGMLQTLKNVFYKEGVPPPDEEFAFLIGRLPGLVQRTVGFPPPARDIFHGPFRSL